MRRVLGPVALGAALVAMPETSAPPVPPAAMVAAARGFLDALTPELKARAQLPFDAEERTNWHYVPRQRQGLPLKAMTDAQRRAAMNLLRAGLSEKGYTKAETIRALEDVLVELGGDPKIRDRELYFFTVFGEPSSQSTWGWRYEGHHLSQNWTVVGGAATATAPQFFGANPAEVRQGRLAGTRPLAAEEDLAFDLLHSLDATQRRAAIVAPQAPPDILTTNSREAAAQEDRGVSYGEMSPPQRDILVKLIEEHAGAQTEPLAKERMDRVRAAGLTGIRFAWMGPAEKGRGHYYRIQGPTFLVEFDNTQNNANHIHQVWRDFKGDFGRDLLADHYRHAPHHQHR
jgi:hypothetical protein